MGGRSEGRGGGQRETGGQEGETRRRGRRRKAQVQLAGGVHDNLHFLLVRNERRERGVLLAEGEAGVRAGAVHVHIMGGIRVAGGALGPQARRAVVVVLPVCAGSVLSHVTDALLLSPKQHKSIEQVLVYPEYHLKVSPSFG